MNIEDRVNTLSKYYKKLYGQRVFKLGLSTGLECPQRIKGSPCVFCIPETFIEESFNKKISINDQIAFLANKLLHKFGNIGFSAYFQDNTSTFGDPDYLYSLFAEADKHSLINEIVISGRPDCLDHKLLERLMKLKKPLTIELGIQSIHDKSLLLLKRGHTQIDNQKAINLLKDYQIRTAIHLILGIPNETKADILESIDWLNDMKIAEVKFHHLVVYQGTDLENLYLNTEFKQAYTDLTSYCSLLSEIITRLESNCVISRFFTSNLSQSGISLNQFPGIKKNWLNELTKILNKNNIRQGER